MARRRRRSSGRESLRSKVSYLFHPKAKRARRGRLKAAGRKVPWWLR